MYKNRGKTLVFGLIMLTVFALFSTCKNSIMEKWWENKEPESVVEGFYVTFETNGGSPAVPAQYLDAGQLIQRPPAVTRPKDLNETEWYIFAGWYTADGTEWDFDKDTMPEKDIILHAVWREDTSANILVTFVSNEGSEVSPQYVKAGDRIIPPITARDGYTFEGWFLDEEFEFKFDFSKPVSNEDLTLYAKWLEVKTFYTVAFDINGGFPYVADQHLTAGELIQEPEQVYKQIDNKWFIFVGWFTVEGEIWDFNEDTMPADDISLYAVWRDPAPSVPNKVTVTYELNGGDSISPNPREYDQGKIAPPLPPDVTRSGFTFDGWFTTPELRYEFNFDLPLYEDITLYAKWDDGNVSGGENFCFVVFDSNGGTPQPRTIKVEYGVVIGRLQPMTRSGFGFLGWFDEGGNQWDVETQPVTKDDVNAEGLLFLSAQWEAISQTVFTVTFDADSTYSDAIIPDQLIVSGGKIVQPIVPKPKSSGSGFDGWYYNDQLWDFNDPITGTMTLIAQWHTSYRVVRFEPDGGTRPGGTMPFTHEFAISTSANYGIVPDPGPLVKTGYSFGGWWYTNDIDFEFKQWDFAVDRVTVPSPSAPDLVLYANWIPQERVVIFDQNGGSGVSPNTFTYPIGSKLVNPGAPTRLGFTFLGWFHDPACTPGNGLRIMDYTVPGTDGLTEADPIYFYAGWRTAQLLVTFNIVDSGSGPGTGQLTEYNQLVDYGSLVNKPPVTPPESANPIEQVGFDGKWFRDSGLTIEWDFNTDRITANTNLYGKYEVPGHSVTFVLRLHPSLGASDYETPPPQYVLNGEKAVEPFMPSLSPPPQGVAETRWSFYCWDTSTDGGNTFTGTYDFDTPVNTNITLYARWVPPVPDMVWVPRGSFIMGDAGVSGSPAAYHAYPTRRVTLDGYYISRYEITQIDEAPLVQRNTGYIDLMGTNPSQFTGTKSRPVENVSWADAMAYCDARSARESLTKPTYNPTTRTWTGDGYRLPTEAEWEYAAKGGYYWEEYSSKNYIYAGSSNPDTVAWYNVTVKGEPAGFQTTQTVGLKTPNQIGIYDMSGNLSEWCYDWFTPYSTLQDQLINPIGGSGPYPQATATGRVRRGGAWNNAVGNVRLAVRNSEDPSAAHWAVGFRVVRGPSGIY